jgi:hypothetical protein
MAEKKGGGEYRASFSRLVLHILSILPQPIFVTLTKYHLSLTNEKTRRKVVRQLVQGNSGTD